MGARELGDDEKTREWGERRRKILISNVFDVHTYINHFTKVALSQIMQYRSLIEMSQIGHIFDFLEFWWIDWWEEVSFEGLFLLNDECVSIVVNEFVISVKMWLKFLWTRQTDRTFVVFDALSWYYLSAGKTNGD